MIYVYEYGQTQLDEIIEAVADVVCHNKLASSLSSPS